MPYHIEAKVPFRYQVVILPAVRTFEMGEVYDVEVDDAGVTDIPTARFKLLTAKVTDEDLFVEDLPIRILYNGLARFDGIVTRILKREDAPIWELEAEGGLAILRDTEVLTVLEYEDTPRNEIATALLPDGWIHEPIPTLPKMDYKSEHGSVLDAMKKVIGDAGYEYYAAWYDGHFRLYVTQQRGVLIDGKVWRINRDLYETQREQDRTRDPTVAVVPGATAATQDQSATIGLFSVAQTFTTVDEPWLTESIDESQTSIPVSWTDDLFDGMTTGIIGLGTERILVGSITATSVEGCVRGYQNTTAQPHDAYEGVLRVKSMPVESTEGFPDSGSIWVGVEKIRYSSKVADAFVGLSREQPKESGGTELTSRYGHCAGALVINGEGETTAWSVTNPEPGSPIALKGVRSVRVDGTGLNDQNALDMAAQRLLLGKAGPLEGGTCKLIDTSFHRPVSIGDQILIEEADGSKSTRYRITGLKFSMTDATIEISLGSPQQAFQNSLSRYNRTINRADSRAPLGDTGRVVTVASDQTTMLVETPDGSQTWVKCGLKPKL
jgi:hypothetical protein